MFLSTLSCLKSPGKCDAGVEYLQPARKSATEIVPGRALLNTEANKDSGGGGVEGKGEKGTRSKGAKRRRIRQKDRKYVRQQDTKLSYNKDKEVRGGGQEKPDSMSALEDVRSRFTHNKVCTPIRDLTHTV